MYRYDGTELVPLNALRRGGVPLPPVPCNELLALPDGQLWLGTEAGLFRFRPDGVLESLPLPSAAGSSRFITALALAADGQRVWVGQQGTGVRAYTRAGRPAPPLLKAGSNVGDIWTAPDGTLWLAATDSLRLGAS
ncbi:hypothetical protein [Hymenobacter psychrotolerans]|uniref:Two component regulator propeller n=1 Tax=Hymenobacter psychrotolerans DSM 18569 TaxID=1121959 RepID=A0A1M7AJI7_9BACT|nr:hypothetical protein [Hymenobacter psychrotolerans]SHL42930.1 hypothetical protein SAMN02746009_02746 [Hymenobacter psychrotolerans DSM 18569]